jgi:hypothetical protein
MGSIVFISFNLETASSHIWEEIEWAHSVLEMFKHGFGRDELNYFVSLIASADGYFTFVIFVPLVYAYVWIFRAEAVKLELVERGGAPSITNIATFSLLFALATFIYGSLIVGGVCFIRDDSYFVALSQMARLVPYDVITSNYILFAVLFAILFGTIVWFWLEFLQSSRKFWKYMLVHTFIILVVSLILILGAAVVLVTFAKAIAALVC